MAKGRESKKPRKTGGRISSLRVRAYDQLIMVMTKELGITKKIKMLCKERWSHFHSKGILVILLSTLAHAQNAPRLENEM